MKKIISENEIKVKVIKFEIQQKIFAKFFKLYFTLNTENYCDLHFFHNSDNLPKTLFGVYFSKLIMLKCFRVSQIKIRLLFEVPVYHEIDFLMCP